MDMMILRLTDRDLATRISLARVGFGLGFLIAPGLIPRLLGVDRQTATRISWLPRMVAGREIALGGGTLATASAGAAVERWMAAQALCDATDGFAVLAALRRRHVNRLTGALFVLFAAGGAAGSALAALEARR